MRERKRDKSRLEDILKCIDNVRQFVRDIDFECTAEPTLLCTFSVVSLFSNIIFCIFANRNYYMYALKWHKDR